MFNMKRRYIHWEKMRGRGPGRTFTLLPLKISPTTPSLSQTSWINSKIHNRCCYVQLTIIQKIQPGSVYLDSYGEIFLMFTTQILGLSKKKKKKAASFQPKHSVECILHLHVILQLLKVIRRIKYGWRLMRSSYR